TLKNGRLVQTHLAAREIRAKAILMSVDELAPGQSDYAQLRLIDPVAARRGDRLVIRLPSPAVTVGGGEVLGPCPLKRRRKKPEVLKRFEIVAHGDLKARTELAVLESPGSFAPFKELALRADLGPLALAEAKILAEKGTLVALSPEIFIHAAEFESLTAKLKALLAKRHQADPHSPGLPLEEVRSRLAPMAPQAALLGLLGLWEKKGLTVREEGLLRLSSFEPQVDESQNQFVALLEKTYQDFGVAPLATSAVMPPKSPDEARRRKAAFAVLAQKGRLIRLDDLYHVSQKAYEEAFQAFTSLAKDGPVEPGPFRDQLKASRKVAVALLESFEKRGLTVKAGSGRLPR
ncbi:MAG: SelB C-terminal domain-containing protein, partial [Deltaproteobacteria bacterium]|nr:SelB C-terminal domain-containing protein [Deltaproteobacteria bacterium]